MVELKEHKELKISGSITWIIFIDLILIGACLFKWLIS